jgi:hypothetical protein
MDDIDRLSAVTPDPEVCPMCRSLIVLALLAVPVVALAQPQIVIDPGQLDFGTLAQHETRDAEVIITNTGDELLEIRDIESSCGCTVPELTAYELAPGESTVMAVHFNSKTFQGKQTKYVHIFSNDPRQSSVDLIVQANIKVPIVMDPGKAMIGFRTLQVGETETVTYTFSSEEVAELQIEPSTWPQQWLDVAVRQGATPQTVQVDFSVKQDAVPGRHRDPVKLRTNVAAVPVINLSADVKLISDLVVNPEKVNLRMVRPSQPLKTRVSVAPYRPGTEFEVTAAKVDIPGLRARIDGGGRETVIWLDGESLPADHERVAANGAVKGTLTLHTNLASSPELTIPVMYMVRP